MSAERVVEPGAYAHDAAVLARVSKFGCLALAGVQDAAVRLYMLGNVIHDRPLFESAQQSIVATVVAGGFAAVFHGLEKHFEQSADQLRSQDS